MKEKLKLLLVNHKDKVEHVALGILSLVLATIGLHVYSNYGLGWASAYITTTIGVLYELQQKYRKEGEVSVADAVATALPGWLVLLWTKVF